MGEVELRNITLKTDNLMKGRYFAEVVNQTFDEYSKDQYTYAENRLSIYGRDIREWDMLANWFSTHGMGNKHNKWLIQIPRVYSVWRGINAVNSYAHYLENIFKPMWEASINPSQYPLLNAFLNHVSGFDSVDNEATVDLAFEPKPPGSWRSVENPPYNYYMYYLWANIRTLNEYRSKKGLSTFTLRPHCGESGSDDHLIGCFLVADAINHGINLTHDPSTEYLYYLAQIGLAVSPLSNNALFLSYLKNPFPQFFHRGMNVSLSTDDPLMFHQTKEPLIEEYAIAQMVWGFTNNDLCEIARNSVLQCGFDHEWKKEKIGPRYFFSSSIGNQPSKTHLSDVRVAYRWETYHAEVAFLEEQSGHTRFVPKAMKTLQEENLMFEHEDVPQEPILCTILDEEVAVVQREVDEVSETLMSTKSELTRARHQTKVLVEHVGEEVTKIEQLQAAIARLQRLPVPLSTHEYPGRGTHHKRGTNRSATARQHLLSQLSSNSNVSHNPENAAGHEGSGFASPRRTPQYHPNRLLHPVFNEMLTYRNIRESTPATDDDTEAHASHQPSLNYEQDENPGKMVSDCVLPQTRQFAGAFSGFVRSDNKFDDEDASEVIDQSGPENRGENVVQRLHQIDGPCCGAYANEPKIAAMHYAAVDQFYKTTRSGSSQDMSGNGGDIGLKLPPLPPVRRRF